MSSLIEGYPYDIFISYRQKDNKHDGWVTEFVDNLKGELESTFKEEISVYFDINPHDGLLETHDVDASLQEKLKCVIFVPIISRTYCDPKSFAWEHEFKAFVEQASQDQFGMKVKLPKGNVASRVLPIRIYDLNSTDIKLCEMLLGSVLRGVEFVYAEPGVNRPLKPDDDEKVNLNKTKYRNQINKVGNAIQEIISGLLTEPIELVKENPLQKESLEEVKKEEKKEVQEKPAKVGKWKLLYVIALVAMLIIVAILVYPKIFKSNSLEKLRSSGERISVAVMPFQNMTNDTIWDVWQNGIQNELITALTNTEDLKVRQIESINDLIKRKYLVNEASLTPSVACLISQKLDAKILIYGSIKYEGSILRLSTQLINSKTEEIFKSFQVEGEIDKVLPLVDSLSVTIKNYLIITQLGRKVTPETKHLANTSSPEAYKLFLYGLRAFMVKDYGRAENMFLQALAIDSGFTFAALSLSVAFGNQGLYDDAKKWCLNAYSKRDNMPVWQKTWINWVHAIYFESPIEEIEYLKQLKEIDDQYSNPYSNLGYCYNVLHQFENAIPELEWVLKMYDEWEIKPSWVYDYTQLGYAYHKTGKYWKEKRLYRIAEKAFPNDPDLVQQQAILSLSQGKKVEAEHHIKKYSSLLKDKSSSESDIFTSLASLHMEANDLNKAEDYYRKALSLEASNPNRLKNLASFLVNNDFYLNESIDLINKAIEMEPDNYSFLDCKGWCLYKQARYKEALELLEKSWSLKPVYDHEIFLHLEAARKAIISQMKNN